MRLHWHKKWRVRTEEKLKTWKRRHLLKRWLRRQADRIVEVIGNAHENKLEGLRKDSEGPILRWETIHEASS